MCKTVLTYFELTYLELHKCDLRSTEESHRLISSLKSFPGLFNAQGNARVIARWWDYQP